MSRGNFFDLPAMQGKPPSVTSPIPAIQQSRGRTGYGPQYSGDLGVGISEAGRAVSDAMSASSNYALQMKMYQHQEAKAEDVNHFNTIASLLDMGHRRDIARMIAEGERAKQLTTDQFTAIDRMKTATGNIKALHDTARTNADMLHQSIAKRALAGQGARADMAASKALITMYAGAESAKRQDDQAMVLGVKTGKDQLYNSILDSVDHSAAAPPSLDEAVGAVVRSAFKDSPVIANVEDHAKWMMRSNGYTDPTASSVSTTASPGVLKAWETASRMFGVVGATGNEATEKVGKETWQAMATRMLPSMERQLAALQPNAAAEWKRTFGDRANIDAISKATLAEIAVDPSALGRFKERMGVAPAAPASVSDPYAPSVPFVGTTSGAPASYQAGEAVGGALQNLGAVTERSGLAALRFGSGVKEAFSNAAAGATGGPAPVAASAAPPSGAAESYLRLKARVEGVREYLNPGEEPTPVRAIGDRYLETMANHGTGVTTRAIHRMSDAAGAQDALTREKLRQDFEALRSTRERVKSMEAADQVSSIAQASEFARAVSVAVRSGDKMTARMLADRYPDLWAELNIYEHPERFGALRGQFDAARGELDEGKRSAAFKALSDEVNLIEVQASGALYDSTGAFDEDLRAIYESDPTTTAPGGVPADDLMANARRKQSRLDAARRLVQGDPGLIIDKETVESYTRDLTDAQAIEDIERKTYDLGVINLRKANRSMETVQANTQTYGTSADLLKSIPEATVQRLKSRGYWGYVERMSHDIDKDLEGLKKLNGDGGSTGGGEDDALGAPGTMMGGTTSPAPKQPSQRGAMSLGGGGDGTEDESGGLTPAKPAQPAMSMGGY